MKNKHLLGTGVTRTPTPFKRALAELRKQTVDSSGSGHLVDDITEIIDKENGKGATKSGGSAADSMYETDVSNIKQEEDGEQKKGTRKVRKSLLSSAWEMSDLPYLAETPVSRGGGGSAERERVCVTINNNRPFPRCCHCRASR